MSALHLILQTGKLSNMQMELLKVFKEDMPDKDVLEVKQLLAEYFMGKALQEFDSLETKNGWTAETYKQWGKEHFRKSVTL